MESRPTVASDEKHPQRMVIDAADAGLRRALCGGGGTGGPPRVCAVGCSERLDRPLGRPSDAESDRSTIGPLIIVWPRDGQRSSSRIRKRPGASVRGWVFACGEPKRDSVRAPAFPLLGAVAIGSPGAPSVAHRLFLSLERSQVDLEQIRVVKAPMGAAVGRRRRWCQAGVRAGRCCRGVCR